MSFLAGIPLIGKVIDGVINIIDQKVEDKDLKTQIKAELERYASDNSAEFEKEVTKRWTSDKDGFLTRNIRPLGFAFVLILFGAVMLCDGNIGSFTIKETYTPVIESLLDLFVVAYVGSRGIEKGISIFKK